MKHKVLLKFMQHPLFGLFAIDNMDWVGLYFWFDLHIFYLICRCHNALLLWSISFFRQYCSSVLSSYCLGIFILHHCCHDLYFLIFLIVQIHLLFDLQYIWPFSHRGILPLFFSEGQTFWLKTPNEWFFHSD